MVPLKKPPPTIFILLPNKPAACLKVASQSSSGLGSWFSLCLFFTFSSRFLGVQKLKEHTCGLLKIKPNKLTQRVPDRCLISKAQAVSKETMAAGMCFIYRLKG